MLRKSTIFSLSVLLCFCNSVFSNNNTLPPPVNDICSGAIDLGVIECEFYVEFFEDPEATPDIEATGNCISNTEIGQWYTFSTPDPLHYGTLLHFSPTAKVEVFKTTSDCSDLVYVDCGIGPFAFKPEPSTTYYYLTNGGLHVQPPSSGLSTCDDPLVSFNFTQNPIITSTYTDCGATSPDVNCENDHVIWIGYTVGCGESSEVLIEVSEYSANPAITAGEISITVALFDCSTLLSEYDVNGQGYVCSAIGAGESINLVDLPPGISFVIGLGSSLNNTGYFDLNITETTIEGELLNDLCEDAEELDLGINTGLSNACSMPDILMLDCVPQSEATVWYEFDPGNDLQNLLITLYPIGIELPAITIYDECGGNVLETICGTTLELMCIDSPILIQVGSAFVDGGIFDLEIESTPSLPPIEPIITGNNICSGEEVEISIDIPGGEIVSIEVEVSPFSSPSITGLTNQTFSGVSSAIISDILFNSSSTPQEAIYLIDVKAPDGFCSAEQIEISVIVYPGFTKNEYSLDECSPFIFDVNTSQIIMGGTMPYLSTNWYWNSTDLIGSDDALSIELDESGTVTLVVVDSEGCTESATVDIELTPTTTPSFDFPLSYCRSQQDLIEFPATSLENIQGSWSIPIFDLNVFANDGAYNIIFWADEPHCIDPVLLSIQIYSGPEPLFDLPEIICSEENEYTFPSVDLNGLMGEWDIPILDVSMISGVQTNTFTPDSEDCYTPYEYVFEIPETIELEFDHPDSLCRIDEPYMLNNMSLAGYMGNWDIPIIDPNSVTENSITSTWTPIPGQSPCLYETNITVQITDPLIPDFNLPDELCFLDGIYTFPMLDLQSIDGIWSVPSFDPSEITGSIHSEFIPSDNCIESFIWEIEIVEPLIPEFNIEVQICELENTFTLPLISNNGISGTWSQSTIDPSMSVGEQITITFQGDPTEFCVQPIELTIEIIQAQDPIFDLQNILCWTDEDMVLPSSSENSINGDWTISTILVQSNLGEVISSTFTPNDGSCSNEEIQAFEIIAPYTVNPIITDPSDCVLEDGSISMDIIQGSNLEFSIDGGSSWQSSTLFPSLASGGYTILIRSTYLHSCETSLESFLNSPDGPVINGVQSIDINNCIVDNGIIIVDAEGNNLEYSIDGGLTWQSSNEFNNLLAGEYVISIQESMSDCIEEINATILDFPETEILNVNTFEISDCINGDGQIEIVAIGDALEYSIDNGTTWSSQNTFTNLSAGEFVILVQSINGEDCFATTTVELLAPDSPIITNLFVQNPTECSPSTGRIEIEAEGNNIEYSIDGGQTWQTNNIFEDLPSNQYQIIIRDTERINCIAEDEIIIVLDEESLQENTINITPPSACDFEDANFEIFNSILEVEYSIDGGQTWQNTSLFANLSAGIYELITRKILLPECLIIQTIEIPNTACPCNDLLLEFLMSNISCTGEDSALVELVTIQGMNNPNIDINWQNGDTDPITEVYGEGWQMVSIAYDDDCSWLDSVWVELVKPIQFEVYTKDLDCPELNNGFLEILNVEGGSGEYRYSLDGISYQTERLFENLQAIEYEVYVVDETNCLTINEIQIYANDKIEILLPEIEVITIGKSILLDPQIDIDKIDSFAWSPIEGILNPNDLTITVSPQESITYTLEIFYGECTELKEVSIEVNPEEDVHIANVFSPNGNNNNIFLQGIPNSTIELYDFSIYDRWGNKLFNVSQPSFNNKGDGWDGYYQGALATSGVYVYQVNYTQYGEPKTKIGTLTLLY
jgi:gliding motility-associated-like protein